MRTSLLAVFLTSTAAAAADTSCLRPLSTPAASHEIFAFTTGNSWKHYLKFTPRVTTIALFGTPTPELVCAAHNHSVRVVVGTQFGGDLTNSTARAAYVTETVARMASAGVDGFNVDIEGNSAHRDELTALVTELSTEARKANPHAQITFDLAIFPKGQTQGYDHAALAKVLDFIVPMAYDECWGAATAEANSPYDALTGGVQQYKDLGVPAEKLVLGLPWYAWDFPCDSSESYGACHITVPKGKQWFGYATQISYSAANTTAEHGFVRDKSSHTMVTEYFENASGTQKRHQQWFDNPETLSEKYAHVGDLGCKGVAFWTADEVDYTTSQGEDMWNALSYFKPHAIDITHNVFV